MPCFCKSTQIVVPPPNLRLAVMAVPPQLSDLLGLLDLPPDGLRLDERLGQTLPPGGPSWIRATIQAQAPGVRLPAVLPPGGGAMMSAMLSLSAAAKVFPLNNTRRLLAELQQALSSLAHNILPQVQALSTINPVGLQRMALAARLTLALRAKGVCPMVLAKVDVNAQYAGGSAAVRAGFNYAATMPQMNVRPFALPAAQLRLAQHLSALAPLGAAGMPPLSDPNLIARLKAQIRMLAAMPVPKLPVTPAMLAALADLDAIHQAFGLDATTPAGVARVNAMLRFVASLSLPMPTVAVNLTQSLSVTPKLPDVLTGMQTVSTAGASLAASLTTSFKVPPIIPVLEMAATMSAILPKGVPCGVCNFPLDAVAQSLAQVPLPDAPADLPF